MLRRATMISWGRHVVARRREPRVRARHRAPGPLPHVQRGARRASRRACARRRTTSPTTPSGCSPTDGWPTCTPESLWELIEARAAATPDGLLVGRRARPHDHLRRVPRRVPSAPRRGFAAIGVREGTPVSWQLPTWIESLVVVGALARLGAVQNPILPISREREVGLHHPPDRRARGWSCRARGAASISSPWPGAPASPSIRRVAGNADGPEIPKPEILVVERDLDRDPARSCRRWGRSRRSHARRRTRFAGSSTRRARRPTRRACATPTRRSRPRRPGSPAPTTSPPPTASRSVFPLTHVGGIASLFSFLQTGAGAILDEAFDPDRTIDVLRRHGVTLAGAGTAFWLAYLAAQRRRPAEKLFPEVRALVGGGAPKPPTLHAEVKAEIGGVGVASGYGLTECPSLALGTVRDPDDKLAVTEGHAVDGVEIRVAGPGDEVLPAGHEGEIRVRGPMLFQRLRRPVARRRRARRRRLLPHRRPRPPRRRRLPRDHRPAQGRHHPQG